MSAPVHDPGAPRSLALRLVDTAFAISGLALRHKTFLARPVSPFFFHHAAAVARFLSGLALCHAEAAAFCLSRLAA